MGRSLSSAKQDGGGHRRHIFRLDHLGMRAVIHSDQGRKFENHLMQELSPVSGTQNPYNSISPGLVEWFNRTLLMMLAMFAGEHCDDWDNLLPAVMMAYRSSVRESSGSSPYRLMFGEECTLPMKSGCPDVTQTRLIRFRTRMLSGLETL